MIRDDEVTMLWRWQLIGAHVHVDVWAGYRKDKGHRGKAGKLVFREKEFFELQFMLAGSKSIEFEEWNPKKILESEKI